MFIGIVIGRWPDVKKCWLEITRRLNLDEIHMYKLKVDLKRRVLKLLCGYCGNLNLMCVKVDYPRLKNVARSIKPRAPRRKIADITNAVVRETLYKIIEEYPGEKTIIVDRELKEVMRIETHEPREPIEIADIIAWYNLRSSSIPRELRKDLRKHITELDVENLLVWAIQRKLRAH